MMRLEALFKLVDYKYHYDQHFKGLKEALVKDKFKPADIRKLETMFTACKKAHDDREKQSHKEYDRERLSPMTIYDLSAGD
jgi:5-methylcytosine-specific restriction endonuclease McrA